MPKQSMSMPKQSVSIPKQPIAPISRQEAWPFIVLPGLKLLIHLLTFRGYGIFRDELYYLACSDRLAAGYVDQPPLSIFLLRLVRETLGESLLAIRLVPALAGAATVLLVGLMARRLGGGRLAQCLAMVAAIAVPAYLALNHFYSMNALDILLWTAAAYLLIAIVQDGNKRQWLALGVVLGLGLLNKISVLWLGFGLGAGLLLTAQRRTLRTAGPWLAAGVAALLFLPHLLWQLRHGWPTLEFIANATANKMVAVAPFDFVRGQVEMLGTGVSVLALLGLAALLVASWGRHYRLLGWIYLAVLTLLLVNGTSRAGYLAPAYTWLLAAGGVGIERLLARLSHPRWRMAAATLAFLLLVAEGLIAMPFALPVLPADTYVAYARQLGVGPSTEERKELAALPQFYADMHGWKEKATAAQQVLETLPAGDRDQACFFTFNYGVAGALEYFGGTDGPPVISGHNNYWLWGPGTCSGDVVIFMGGKKEELGERFATIEQVATVDCGHCMPYENHQPIFVARGFQGDLGELWPGLKHFD